MVENNEILNTTEENNAEEVTETVTESDDLAESDVETTEETEAPAAKKKSILQLPIIISIAIVAAVFVVFLVMKCFFNTSIVGTWVVDPDTSTSDEASENSYSAYYTFDEDGTLTISQGTVKMIAEYQITQDEDGTNYMYSSVFSEEYAYSVTGNVFGGRKLILTGSNYTGALTSANAKTPTLKASDDFEPSDKLTGVWSIPDYGISYEFKDDGKFVFNQSDVYFYEGTYTYTDDELQFIYYASEETTVSANYAFDGDNVIVINGLGYYKTAPDGSLIATADEY